MEENIAQKLSLLATQVDSLAKARVLAEAERDREASRRTRVEAEAEELRAELRQARRRAKAAERALAKLAANSEATVHTAEINERELRARLDDAEQAKKVLRHEVEQTERERRALEVHLREVLRNLRHAARDAQHTRPAVDEVTLVPSRAPDNGW